MSQQQQKPDARPPPQTISLPQAQRITNLLQAARDEFVSLVASFPPSHPSIVAVLGRYPELILQELERVLDEGRGLLIQIRDDYTHLPSWQRAQASVELHGRVQRQYTRFRDMLYFVTVDLDEFNHLRVRQAPRLSQNSSPPSRPANTSQPPSRRGVAETSGQSCQSHVGAPQVSSQILPSRSGATSLFTNPNPPTAAKVYRHLKH